MESGTSLCLIVYFLVCSSEAQTNITAEIIPAVLGQDVILPCKVPNHKILITAVEWIRPDQDPEYVLLYRDGYFVPENQHPSYQNRVDLNEEKMKDGDVSLILKNVMKNDTGRYDCQVFPKGTNRRKRSNLGNDPINIINLVVHQPGEKFEGDQDGIIRDGGNKTGIIVGSVVGVILLLAVVYVGVLIYRRRRIQTSHFLLMIQQLNCYNSFPEQHQQQPQLV